ncbi:hypothetical protein N7326_05260 [Corynebacterium sp. ES2794-CONJ1]|uniref:hypothetical protein n=1 Tax=Corynebacterium sp. ES2794-CONJ1 TaxID=2980553 RepID=UPI0021D8507A|nr:hypothetical protein [Corynebacterium sp. ES2794-CONJ1]MCU9519283.1 hypothetical protein [Corynebacterium sp. ES2794-CONJ1]
MEIFNQRAAAMGWDTINHPLVAAADVSPSFFVIWGELINNLDWIKTVLSILLSGVAYFYKSVLHNLNRDRRDDALIGPAPLNHDFLRDADYSISENLILERNWYKIHKARSLIGAVFPVNYRVHFGLIVCIVLVFPILSVPVLKISQTSFPSDVHGLENWFTYIWIPILIFSSLLYWVIRGVDFRRFFIGKALLDYMGSQTGTKAYGSTLFLGIWMARSKVVEMHLMLYNGFLAALAVSASACIWSLICSIFFGSEPVLGVFNFLLLFIISLLFLILFISFYEYWPRRFWSKILLKSNHVSDKSDLPYAFYPAYRVEIAELLKNSHFVKLITSLTSDKPISQIKFARITAGGVQIKGRGPQRNRLQRTILNMRSVRHDYSSLYTEDFETSSPIYLKLYPLLAFFFSMTAVSKPPGLAEGEIGPFTLIKNHWEALPRLGLFSLLLLSILWLVMGICAWSLRSRDEKCLGYLKESLSEYVSDQYLVSKSYQLWWRKSHLYDSGPGTFPVMSRKNWYRKLRYLYKRMN